MKDVPCRKRLSCPDRRSVLEDLASGKSIEIMELTMEVKIVFKREVKGLFLQKQMLQ